MTDLRTSSVIGEAMTVSPSTVRVSSMITEVMSRQTSTVRVSSVILEAMILLYPPEPEPSGGAGLVGDVPVTGFAVGSTPITKIMLGSTELWSAT